MSNEKTYTAKDIQRYHRGEMSAAEMHLLEKAALDDPMLADALEGYTFTNTGPADVETLQSKLQQRVSQNEEKGRVVFFHPLLKIAAIFLLIAGAGWLVFQTFSGTDNNLAISQEDNSGIQKIQRPAATADSMAATQETTTSDSFSNREDVVANKPTPSTTPGVPGHTAAVPLFERKAEPSTDLQASTAPVTADATEKKKEAAAEQGTETFKEKDFAKSSRTNNDTIHNLDIVLRKTNTPVEEVVINKSKAQPRARKMPVVDTLEPERGWHSFDDYVAQNLNAPDEVKLKPTSESEVELSFQVDKEGNPFNITVTKSLCKKCDEEAIRLLKEGPKWKGRKGNGKVKIKF